MGSAGANIDETLFEIGAMLLEVAELTDTQIQVLVKNHPQAHPLYY